MCNISANKENIRPAIVGFLNEFEAAFENYDIAKNLIKNKLLEIKESGIGFETISNEQIVFILDNIKKWNSFEYWTLGLQLIQEGVLNSDDIQDIFIYIQQEGLLRNKELGESIKANPDLLDRQSLRVKTKIKVILDME